MSLMSAGKQISVGSNQAYGRGLFVVDPDVAQRQANKKNAYKQQLRIQMEEQALRKEAQKKKLREEDDRLEKKFYAQIDKEKQKKNDRQPARNDKNIPPQPPQGQRSQMIKSELFKQQQQPLRQNNMDFKFSLRANTQEDYSRNSNANPYLQRQPNLVQMQQQQFFDQTSSQKLRAMKEMLEEKMNEVYRKINQSKNLDIDKEIQLIRKKINHTNVNYENQNPKIKEFQNEFSQFYKIPKKMTYEENPIKNLNYDSRTQLKRKQYAYQKNQSPYAPEQRMPMSRNRQSRESNISNSEGWGRQRGKSNFLSNRQAADFQIQSISNNIDNILNEYDK